MEKVCPCLHLEYSTNFMASKLNVLLENGTETVPPAYSLWHVGFGLDVLNSQRILYSFTLQLNNVFKKAYQPHLSD